MVLIFASLIHFAARADLVSSGYYKIHRKGEHVGFSVRQEHFDRASREWTFKTFIFTVDRDRNENYISLVTKHKENLAPIESAYEAVSGTAKSHTRMLFKGAGYTIQFKAGNKMMTENSVRQPDDFLRAATYRVLLRHNPKKGKAFRFQAVREEHGKPGAGHITIRDEITVGGQKIYQIVDDFEAFTEEVWLTNAGQVLFSRLTNTDVTEELAESADQATGQLPVRRSEMIKVFGEIPSGAKNLRGQMKTKRDPKWFKSDFKTRQEPVPNAETLRITGVSK